MTHVSKALSQYFSQGNKSIEIVLCHCRFSPQEDAQHLAIYCPHKLFDEVLTHFYTLNWQGSRALLKTLSLYSVKDGQEAAAINLMPSDFPRPIHQQKLDALGLSLLLKLGVNFDHPLAIVEMGTNRGVFCSEGIIQQSRAGNIDSWMDRDMAKYHYPEGLATLERAYESGIASGVRWIAKTFEGDPLEIAANVYAGELNGVPVRVTENLHWQIV